MLEVLDLSAVWSARPSRYSTEAGAQEAQMPANSPSAVGAIDVRRTQTDDAASMIADGDHGAYQLALERGQVTFHHVAGPGT